MVLRVVVFLEVLLHPSIFNRSPQISSSISNWIMGGFRDRLQLGIFPGIFDFLAYPKQHNPSVLSMRLVSDGRLSFR